MLGVDYMSTREINIELLKIMPEDIQTQIFAYLTTNFCMQSPFKPKTAEEIFAELEESRQCYDRGDYKDFGTALSEIRQKYGL